MHSYIQRGGDLALRTEQATLALCRRLWAHGGSFGLEERSHIGAMSWLPVPLVKMARIARLVLPLVGWKLGWRAGSTRIELDAFGHVALPLRIGGTKVFDLETRTVTTQLGTKLPAVAATRQIDRAERAARTGLAPRLVSADASRRCWTETCLVGVHPPPFRQDLGCVETLVSPLIAELQRAEPPTLEPLATYVARRRDAILGTTGGLGDAALVGDLDAAQCATVTTLVDDISEALGRLDDTAIPLTLAHGDLHEQNILLTADGPRLLDWANLEARSPYFDMDLVFLREIRRAVRAGDRVDDRCQEIHALWQQGVERLEAQLLSDDNPCARALADSALTPADYRRAAQLELMSKGIEKLQEAPDLAARARRLADMAEWAALFRARERARA